MTRRKLLLWSVPVLGLAVAAGLLVLALTDSRSEAEGKSDEVQVGMTRDQVRAAIGQEWIATEETSYWRYPDGSHFEVHFDDRGRTKLKYHSGEKRSWWTRMRGYLRNAGLRI